MKPLLVPGGRAFVWPGVQRVQRFYSQKNYTNFCNKLIYLIVEFRWTQWHFKLSHRPYIHRKAFRFRWQESLKWRFKVKMKICCWCVKWRWCFINRTCSLIKTRWILIDRMRTIFGQIGVRNSTHCLSHIGGTSACHYGLDDGRRDLQG